MLTLYCDINGTVADTKPLTRRAYADVGVIMPDSAWGVPWNEWLIDFCEGDETRATLLHDKKVDRYTALLTRYDMMQFELSAAKVARLALIRDARVTFLTAGDRGSAYTLLSRLNLRSVVHAELTYARRLDILRAAPASAVYLDDSSGTITQLAGDLPDLATVHVTGQTHSALVDEIKRLRWNKKEKV